MSMPTLTYTNTSIVRRQVFYDEPHPAFVLGIGALPIGPSRDYFLGAVVNSLIDILMWHTIFTMEIILLGCMLG